MRIAITEPMTIGRTFGACPATARPADLVFGVVRAVPAVLRAVYTPRRCSGTEHGRKVREVRPSGALVGERRAAKLELGGDAAFDSRVYLNETMHAHAATMNDPADNRGRASPMTPLVTTSLASQLPHSVRHVHLDKSGRDCLA